jgi:hypothetical protein
MALTNKLSAIADAIRSKTGGTHLLTLDQMPEAIRSITGGGGTEIDIPDISGNCSYRFAYGGWNWFIEQYGNKIITKDITNAQHMFYFNPISNIPFDINLKEGSNVSINSIFHNSDIQTPPYIKGKISEANNLFNSCLMLTEIPEDWADYVDWSYTQSTASKMHSMFNGCHSLKKVPQNLIDNLFDATSGSLAYSPYRFAFNTCSVLGEVTSLPVLQGTVSMNHLGNIFNNCSMIKNITFATNEDGSVKTANWKNQTFDLSQYVGWANDATNITSKSRYHGITEDKRVVDHINYNALKEDSDWWTTNQYFSKYNKTSALATINSLPDTSEYLAANSGTNTIKFKGLAGESTDGGAINTLTEEEIAIATAKGWTVTFV